jgi:hypothetical protein
VLRFVLVVLLFAALVYMLVRFLDGRAGRKASWGPAVRRQRDQQRRTVAPDDDEQFLRDLDRKRKDEPPSPG